jgi:hypothetical protein
MRHVYTSKIPITRLIAYAIDQELSKEKPFEGFKYTLPVGETVEYAYAEEASKILAYMKDTKGLGIDQIISLRHDIGVPDVESLLFGLRECVEKEFLEEFLPAVKPNQKTDYPKDYRLYRLTGSNPEAMRKVRRKEKHIKIYEKIKKDIDNGKL